MAMRSNQPIILMVTDASGADVEHKLPTKYEVCTRCRGEGTHVNPAVDGNGISVEDFRDDPDFEEAYFAGTYDVQCETCKGLRVVPVVDEEACKPELLAEYQRQQRDDSEARYEVEMDRRAELRAMGDR